MRSNVKSLKSSHLRSDHWVTVLIGANLEYFTPAINVGPNSIGKWEHHPHNTKRWSIFLSCKIISSSTKNNFSAEGVLFLQWIVVGGILSPKSALTYINLGFYRSIGTCIRNRLHLNAVPLYGSTVLHCVYSRRALGTDLIWRITDG